MRQKRFLRPFKDASLNDLNLVAGSALNFFIRLCTYSLVAVTGIVVARALGAHDRGVYSLVTTIALIYMAFGEFGISKASIYLVGQKRYSLQQVAYNNLSWLLGINAIWLAATITLGILRPGFIPGELRLPYFVIFGLAGALLLFLTFAEDMLITSGSILGYNLLEFSQPFLRCALIMSGVLLLKVGIVGVLYGWLLAVAFTSVVAIWLLSKRVRLRPSLLPNLLKAQLSFGVRSYLGFIFQAVNHRLDVILVARFAGSTALGYYAVAFGMAELLWQIPFALGTVFFPKASALDPQANAETAAVTCRRALFVTLLATVGLLVVGRHLILFLYGAEFLPSVKAFYILLPSAALYTVRKVLSGALEGRGMPEASLYSGLFSFPVTIGLNILLIPAMGITGAAIASIAAYAISAFVMVVIFLRVTRRSVFDILLIKWGDITSSWRAARTFVTKTEAVGAD